MRAAAPETVGLVLLGIALLAVSVGLRSAQPGLLGHPDYIWPVGAAF